MSGNTTQDIKTQPSESRGETEGTFARFRRTVDGVSANAKNYFGQLGYTGSSPQPKADDTKADEAAASPQTHSATPQPEDGSKKPTAFERFMNLGKVRKDWEVDWPPSHWGGDVEAQERNPAFSISKLDAGGADTESPAVQEVAGPPPEPVTLAERIQSMLADVSPVPQSHTSVGDTAKVPPPPPTLVTDPEMVSYLSSPAVMNGSTSKGGQSVWSALDRLRAVFPGQSKDVQPSSSNVPLENMSSERQHTPDEDEDESGVMVYAPLFPDDSSEVELAQSEVIPETESTGQGAQASGPSTGRIHFHGGGKSRKVWVPSRDKISVQVMWWGYRIYLPPPVLEILDNKQIESGKRAALLTTALKWALDRVPMVILPPQARPAMKMLKMCTPYLGYIGSFVAWSWGSIKGFDKGNGVTLTATWLLTIAVIPGTWEGEGTPAPRTDDENKEASHTPESADIPQTPPRHL